MELKKGNLVYLTTPFADLIYLVSKMDGDKVVAKKLDAPPGKWEILSPSLLTKLCDEQEKLLPVNQMEAIERQRAIIFTPPKKVGGKRKKSLDLLMKGLSKQTLDDIFQVLAEAGMKEED